MRTVIVKGFGLYTHIHTTKSVCMNVRKCAYLLINTYVVYGVSSRQAGLF